MSISLVIGYKRPLRFLGVILIGYGIGLLTIRTIVASSSRRVVTIINGPQVSQPAKTPGGVARAPSKSRTPQPVQRLSLERSGSNATLAGNELRILKDLGCFREAHVRSFPDEQHTSIEFVNTASETRLVFWLDYDQTRRLYSSLAPGEVSLQGTFTTHAWVITDQDQVCKQLFQAGREPAKAVIR